MLDVISERNFLVVNEYFQKIRVHNCTPETDRMILEIGEKIDCFLSESIESEQNILLLQGYKMVSVFGDN